MDPPYLWMGAGRVLRERGRPQLRLSGPAVEGGVPFGGGPVGLRVQGWDADGRAVVLPAWDSADLEAEGDLVRLVRPVGCPRVRFGDPRGSVVVVVAFRLQRVQFQKAPPFPPDVLVTSRHNPSKRTWHLQFRRQGDGDGGRLLWAVKSQSFQGYYTWDGQHVWVRARGGQFHLRRLVDGALMLRCLPPPQQEGLWEPVEGVFVCDGVGLWEPGGGLVYQIGEMGCRIVSWSLSPAGDRMVWLQDGASPGLWEVSRRDGFRQARCLTTATPLSAHVSATAAGEVVWATHWGACGVWDARTQAVRPAAEHAVLCSNVSHQLRVFCVEDQEEVCWA